jgi:signal transduction histidine kinase
VRSLRARLLLGAVIWTLGLFVVSGVAFDHFAAYHPRAPRQMHEFFAHPVTLAFALVFLIIGVLQVRRSVGAIQQLRARLAVVRAGRARQLEGVYPSEVQPLVDDLNLLLEQREQTVRRALAKAGDLAHGLKTPLSVLAQEADRADAAGQPELAAAIAHEVERMRRQMDYHLAHARAAASGATPGARCSVLASAEALSRTLLRLHADRGLAIDVRVDAREHVRGQREDLEEVLGNLLDNACKWARSRIIVGAVTDGPDVVITVDDDGPGLAPSMRDAVLQRGVRADEAAPGTGFGLAIVRDLAELYGGSIVLGASPDGGLRATLRLPSAEAVPRDP